MPLTKKKIRRISHVPKTSDLKQTKKVVKATVQDFGQRAAETVISGVDFNMRNPIVTDFLRVYGGERIERINRTTQKKIGKLLARHMESGSSLGVIKRDLRTMYGMSAKRAMDVATTEITRASNFGSWQGYHQVGVKQKEWLATEDSHVRDTHKGLDGEVVGINEEFVTENGSAQFPGDFGIPEEDINCRCGILPVINDRGIRGRRHWKVFDNLRAPWEGRYARTLARAFSVQKTNVIAALDAAWEAA